MAFKANNAENRAIHASEERGVDVPMFGSMRPMRPGILGAPRTSAPRVKAPHIAMPKLPGVAHAQRVMSGRRKYYGEI